MENKYYGPGTEDLTFTPLTRGEERALFERYYSGDLAARDEIIKNHLRLVAKLSLTYSRGLLREDDAISAGNYALVLALETKKFDPTRGFRFASYVRSYIRGAVCKALSKRSFNGVNTTEPEDIFTAPDEMALTGRLEQSRNSERPDNIQGRHKGSYTNGGRVLWAAHGETKVSQLAADHEYEANQLCEARKAALAKAMECLNATERAVITAVSESGVRLADVARTLGISRQAAQQAHKRGMKKLAVALEGRKEELL